MRTLILLHGYGVRSFFWEPIITFFESKFPQIYTPNLQMDNLTILLESTKKYVKEVKEKSEADVYLVGHSLGGIVALLVAQDLGPEIVKKVALLAVPYGEQHIPFKSFTRILIKYQLIPKFLARRRFFSKNTPKRVQKKIFKQVVPESDSMLDEILSDKFFHTDLVTKPLDQESIFFMSEYDKVVPFDQSMKLAEIIGATVVKYSKEKKVAHDDFITGPTIAGEVSDKINTFFLQERWS